MRPLGKNQENLLGSLERHGHWSVAAGWVWDTPSNTRKILETLVKRGMVKKSTVVGRPSGWLSVTPVEQYELSEEGKEYIKGR